jgi:hypothetical protein
MHGIFPAQRNEDGNNDDVTEPPKIELPKSALAAHAALDADEVFRPVIRPTRGLFRQY